MKFYILIKNKEYGEIKSETYSGEDKDYEKIITELFKSNIDLKLDFYDENGDFVVIPQEIVSQSLIYVKRV